VRSSKPKIPVHNVSWADGSEGKAGTSHQTPPNLTTCRRPWTQVLDAKRSYTLEIQLGDPQPCGQPPTPPSPLAAAGLSTPLTVSTIRAIHIMIGTYRSMKPDRSDDLSVPLPAARSITKPRRRRRDPSDTHGHLLAASLLSKVLAPMGRHLHEVFATGHLRFPCAPRRPVAAWMACKTYSRRAHTHSHVRAWNPLPWPASTSDFSATQQLRALLSHVRDSRAYRL
jgi:hypothetical protein